MIEQLRAHRDALLDDRVAALARRAAKEKASSDVLDTAFKSEKSFFPTGMISTSPVTFVGTAIWLPSIMDTKTTESIIYLLAFIIRPQLTVSDRNYL